jgi:putative oxidoreductase
VRRILESRPVRLTVRFVLGGVFIYAGIIKIADAREFARIVVDYRLLPETASVYLAYILPWGELALGVLLASGIWVRQAALAASLLLVAFAGAVVVRNLGGAAGACGCLSLKSSDSESLLTVLIRDAGLLACGAYLIVHREKGAADGASVS